MKNYKGIIKRKSEETVREAFARFAKDSKQITRASLRRSAAQNSILLQLEDDPDEIVATYNGRTIFRAPGTELFDSVLKEIKRRMFRKEIDPDSKIYSQAPKGSLIDVTHELQYA